MKVLDPPLQSRSLSNGLTAVAIQRRGARTANIQAAVRLGVRYEGPGDNGLSHFLEHAIFLGCDGHPDTSAVNEAAERMGEVVEASTGRDTALFEHALDPTRLDDGLALMGALLRTPRFEGLESERAIILEEAMDELDERGRLVDADTLSRLDIWPGDPLGQRIIGPESNIERFDVDDLHRFHRAHFQGPNMVVTVVADDEPATLLAQIERHFSAQPGGQRWAPSAVEPLTGGPYFRYVVDGRSQVDCRLVFRTPGYLHADAGVLQVIKSVLDDGMASRLQHRLGTELGLAYDQWANWERYPDTGAFEIGATVSPGKVPTFVKEAYGLIAGLIAHPPEAEELERVRFRARWLEVSGLEMGEIMALRYGTARLYRGTPLLAAERLALRQDVEPEDIARVAREIFRPEGHVACLVGELSRPAARTLNRVVSDYRLP